LALVLPRSCILCENASLAAARATAWDMSNANRRGGKGKREATKMKTSCWNQCIQYCAKWAVKPTNKTCAQ
jgi:hypothetical protein